MQKLIVLLQTEWVMFVNNVTLSPQEGCLAISLKQLWLCQPWILMSMATISTQSDAHMHSDSVFKISPAFWQIFNSQQSQPSRPGHC